MNPALYICCFLPLIIALMQQAKQRRAAIRQVLRKKHGKRADHMLHPEQYLNKVCTVITISDSNVKGRITEIGDGWLTVDNGKVKNAVNLDYIVRISCTEKDSERG